MRYRTSFRIDNSSKYVNPVSVMANARYFDPRSVKIAVRNGQIWRQMLPWAYTVVVVLLIVLALGLFWPVLSRNHGLHQQRAEMKTEIEQAKSLYFQLQQRNHALQTDQIYVERMARDVLNVGRRGEVIFQFPQYREDSVVKYK